MLDFIRLFRPTQWSKNLFIFAPLIFAQEFFVASLILKTGAAFVIFCLLSSSMYIWNDICDIEKDKLHPKKSSRPIASGKIKIKSAIIIFFAMCIASLIMAFLLATKFFLMSLLFVALQVAYSLKLKHVAIIDVFVIAAGFYIRVVSGGLVIEIPLSSWLLICTFLLALFLSISKRRYELVLLESNASNHRHVLKEYSPYFLDQLIAVVTASIFVAYCLYTVSEETIEKFGTRNLIFSIPFVLYGIFRYLYLIHQKGKGGSPEELILRDKALLINISLWILTVFSVLYIF